VEAEEEEEAGGVEGGDGAGRGAQPPGGEARRQEQDVGQRGAHDDERGRRQPLPRSEVAEGRRLQQAGRDGPDERGDVLVRLAEDPRRRRQGQPGDQVRSEKVEQADWQADERGERERRKRLGAPVAPPPHRAVAHGLHREVGDDRRRDVRDRRHHQMRRNEAGTDRGERRDPEGAPDRGELREPHELRSELHARKRQPMAEHGLVHRSLWDPQANSLAV